MNTKRDIPFFNYPALFKAREQEIMAVMHDVMSRGAYILQKDLKQFEENLKNFLGVKHAFGVADGTNALILALRAAEIGQGHEFEFAFYATAFTADATQLTVGGRCV